MDFARLKVPLKRRTEADITFRMRKIIFHYGSDLARERRRATLKVW